MAYTTVVDFAVVGDQTWRGRKSPDGGHVRRAFKDAGDVLIRAEIAGSDTTDGSGDVVADLSSIFSAISGASVLATGTTFHHLQVTDFTPATFTFRSFDAAGAPELTTAVTWSAIITGTKA